MSQPVQPGTSLVLITGAGRSGTSTIAGTFFHLGHHVPEPYLQGNESNPRGFYESWWPVRFHKKLVSRANVEQTDGRPEALELVREAVDEKVRADLAEWLDTVLSESERVVVKDPRAVWVPWLWTEEAEAKGATISFVTMLRHPAEVLGSRKTYYSDYRSWMAARDFSAMNLCGWINGNLLLERQTRHQPRSFLLYYDLITDWRSQVEKLRAEIGFDAQLTDERAAAVDDFIDPSLRRHEPDWEEWGLPTSLTSIADDAFEALSRLAAAGGHDEAIEAELDAVAERYRSLYADSAAIAQDAASARARTARVEAAREVREEMRTKRRAQAEKATTPPEPPSAATALARKAMEKAPALRKVRERFRRS